ncbi:MAG: hypothetical protein A3D31_17215 [Candidatus Fluviicola riflensis]|nr:MAG: hypothetical protein CHH17_02155 [Candidatus Fluviicola riflensis]OGS76726.1 MAG: hypothetical protein A3D31_17215 [Candidatus Fluviicola riflensis]OGS82919.1 MAG: hypothetical protein A2724_14145 [Fluviicola sp. RIFCSPHIGHO2_01_FULL_43_53]OGS88456.1 MAG: hypothetical protein A3E30_06720 [Fluviicola sp. RIFCSPHIGHO2_12_FULL_43_24]
MKTILIIILLVCTGTAFSQTKLIFHKSHSGPRASFVETIDGNSSNFGVQREPDVNTAELDSVIYLTDTSAIMVTKVCPRYPLYHQLEEKQGLNSWHPGRDTVYFHPLFSKKHALDSIRMVISTEYFFRNDIDSTKFIGYDNAAADPQKVVKQPTEKNGNEVYLLLVFVIALLLFSMVPAGRWSQTAR